MEAPSCREQLPSLSQTSPVKHATSIETIPPISDTLQRPRRYSKADTRTRQLRVDAVQAAKREVLGNIKEEWTWPPSADQLGNRFPRRRNSTLWRERESDTTPQPSRSPSPSDADPYKYELPDAVALALNHGRIKRRKLMDDELQWNEGLRIFLERRDCWTGAEYRQNASTPDKESETLPNTLGDSTFSISSEHPPHGNILSATALNTQNSESPSSASISSQSLAASIPSSVPSSSRTSHSSELLSPTTPASSTTSPPFPVSSACLTTERRLMTLTETFVPIAPSLLSPKDHPFLTPITPALYPILYSKCIVQSIAPSFPINLSHIVGSLVQGWKNDGQWPPKSALPEDGKAAVRKGSLRGKMRALRIEMEGTGETGQVGLERVAKRGVGKVKRVLGG
ncbi:MAG: hypothetical protein Q9213_004658 [Squamulea squamosa]